MFYIGRSSNGRTMDSGSIYLGSSPSLPARKVCYNKFICKKIKNGKSALEDINIEGLVLVQFVGLEVFQKRRNKKNSFCYMDYHIATALGY